MGSVGVLVRVDINLRKVEIGLVGLLLSLPVYCVKMYCDTRADLIDVSQYGAIVLILMVSISVFHLLTSVKIDTGG